jgi:septation ring formation regulator EzrA
VTYRKVIESYYNDINNITDLIGKLVNSYKLLVGGADELNKIALASKSDIRSALKRAKELGEIIDELIRTLDCISYNYVNYSKIKSQAIKGMVEGQNILTEIEEELKLKD